jgi:hypothetical protein
MEFLIAVIALALLMVVILVISAPLRAGGSASRDEPAEGTEREPAEAGHSEHETAHGEPDRDGLDRDAITPAERRAELEAAREAKYREIRDTELDYRTGKLSIEDFAATDGALRAEAVEILNRLAALEALEGEDAGS